MVIAPPDVLIFPSLFPRSKDLDQQSSFVSLHVYLDGLWTTHSQHPEIGGGTWNRRPALPWTIWRLRNNEALEAQWRVAELKAYRDPLCLEPWSEVMVEMVDMFLIINNNQNSNTNNSI